jgi:hypothetical protein
MRERRRERKKRKKWRSKGRGEEEKKTPPLAPSTLCSTRNMSAHSSRPSEPCSHVEAWASARGGPAQAYLPLQRCLVEEWREARARRAAGNAVEVRET